MCMWVKVFKSRPVVTNDGVPKLEKAFFILSKAVSVFSMAAEMAAEPGETAVAVAAFDDGHILNGVRHVEADLRWRLNEVERSETGCQTRRFARLGEGGRD